MLNSLKRYIVVATNRACVDVFVDRNELHAGGESLNFCGNICKYPHIDPYLVAAVGKDEYGKAVLDSMKPYNLNTDYVHILDGVTANNIIHHTSDGDRYMLPGSWTGGLCDKKVLGADDIALLNRCDVVHSALHTPILFDLFNLRKKAGFVLAVDFNDYRQFDEWLSFVDNIDLFFISGNDEVIETLRPWSLKFNTVFIITLAEKGSVALYKGEEIRCDAVPTPNVVDTTGAGDSYQAGFIAEYCLSRDIKKSMEEGSRCASANIQHLGGF
ncbi:MAG: PfkB family carbohydrate kinase [Lachnospiraceae bacterium]|nr:PfkB family carbohydrate kinase [Lachnospiraceae bacterium]